MSAKTDGWARLDAYIAEKGEAEVLAEFCSRIAIGERHSDITLNMGFPWFVFREFIEDKQERMKEWELAKRCLADELVYEELHSVKKADPETVQVAKLQFDAYTKTAGKVSREEWGEKVQVEINQTISVLDALEEARGRLGRMDTLPVPVTIQQENVEI